MKNAIKALNVVLACILLGVVVKCIIDYNQSFEPAQTQIIYPRYIGDSIFGGK